MHQFEMKFVTGLFVMLFLLLVMGGMGAGRGFRSKRGHKTTGDGSMEISHSAQNPEKGLGDSWKDEDDGSYVSSQNICDSWWCGQGQECRPGGDSLPTCVCKEVCPLPPADDVKKEKQPPTEWDWKMKDGEVPDQGSVCGSDGIVYPSECELHRSGCLTANPHLQVVGTPEVCESRRDDEEEEEHPPPKEHDDESPDVMVSPPHPQQPEETNPCGHGRRRRRNSGDNTSPVAGRTNRKKKPSSPPGGKKDATPLLLHETPNLDLETPSNDNDGEEDDYDYDDRDFHNDDDDDLENKDGYPRGGDDCSSLKKMRKSIKKMNRRKSRGGETSENSRTNNNAKRKRGSMHGSTLCTLSEYKIFKEALLKYNEKHLVPSSQVDEDKEKLISRVFGHFDRNHDGALDYEELQRIGFEENLGRPQQRCHAVEFLHYDDINQDGRIDPKEFDAAFAFTGSSISGVTKKKTTRKPILVKGKVGEKLADLRCPFVSSQWSRYGHPVDGLGLDIRDDDDATLLSIPVLELVHAGNFTCRGGSNLGGDDDNDKFLEQPYLLMVTSEPDVQVYPNMVLERPGGGVKFECRVKGEPLPSIRWLKNEAPLSPILLESNKYSAVGPFLELSSVVVADTGAYMCEASNTAGTKVDIASLLVLDEFVEFPSGVKIGTRNESLFVLLHDGGISLYDPTNCRLHQEILGSDIIPGTQEDLVCGSSPCVWGSGIHIPTSYIYASQPLLDRVLVVSLSEMVVVDVIPTISSPFALHYIPHMDQVWIHGQDGGQVVRDAKKKRKHGAKTIEIVEASPVKDMFLPSTAPFASAYLKKEGVRGIYKVDLRSGSYLKSVDLSGFNCLPDRIHFSSLYGLLILECHEPVLHRPTGTLLLDSLTDAVVGHYPHLHGRLFLSPDSRSLITVTPKRTKNNKAATDFVVHQVTQNGLKLRYTVRSPINASDVDFFPSQILQSYDVFASSKGAAHHDKHLLYIDISSGKTEVVPGVGKFSGPQHQQRLIAAQPGGFGHYLVTPGSSSAFVVNGRTRTVNCQIGGGPLQNISSILWLQPTE